MLGRRAEDEADPERFRIWWWVLEYYTLILLLVSGFLLQLLIPKKYIPFF